LVPYLGHFYVVHLLAYLFGVVRANLFYLVCYMLAAPLCGIAFARASGRSPWLALLLPPLAVGYFFQWGFVSFCVGAILLLPACALLYRTFDQPTVPRTVGLFALASALYFCHIVPWAALGAYAIVLAVFELADRRWRGVVHAAVGLGASLGFFFAGLQTAANIGYFKGHRFSGESDGPARLLRRSAQMLDLFANQSLEEWIYATLGLAVLLLLASDAGRKDEPLRVRARVPLAVTVMIALALVTPFSIRHPIEWWMVNIRFVGLAALFAAFLPRGPIEGARALLLGAAVAFSLMLPVRMKRAWSDYSERVEAIVRLIQATPTGSNTLLLFAPGPGRTFTDPDLMPEMAVWREIYNLPLVYRGGFSPYLYEDGFPVKQIASLAAPLVESAHVHPSPLQTHFDAPSMAKGWDYFLVRKDEAELVLPPDGVVRELIDGEWSLWRNLMK
jgi:hypothetical protein